MHDAPYSSARNSFHLVRFLLALLVILCHCYTLRNLATPLNRLTGGQMNEGTLAVDGFLVVSGFLICQSGVRTRNALTFLRNRALRILPGFVCALLFTAFIAGGLAYRGTFAQYLNEPVNGPFAYVWNWLTLNVQGDQWNIAGVFEGNLRQGVNVSLWTVKHEISLYLLMAVLILTHLNRKRPTYIVFHVFFLIVYGLLEGLGVRLWDAQDTRLWVLSHWNYQRFAETGLFFFSGTLLYAYRDKLPRRWYFAVIALLALILSGCFGFLRWVYLFAYPYLLCYLACSPLCSGFARIGDLSFGLYLYSYPIQQLICHVAPALHPLVHFALSLAFALPLAHLSWRMIEQPCLLLKQPRRPKNA